MAGRQRAGDGLAVVVELTDGTRCVLLAWMLDDTLCQTHKDATQPRISIEVLRALRRLVDAQPTYRMEREVLLEVPVPRARPETCT